MNKEKIENILNKLLATGGDFAEVFLENTTKRNFNYIDNKLDNISIKNTYGLGLRLAEDRTVYYASTNDLSDENIDNIIDDLSENINSKIIYNDIKLDEYKLYKKDVLHKYSDLEIKNKLKEINDKIYSKDKRIIQVNLNYSEELQIVTIANNNGKYVGEERPRARIFISVNFKDGESIANIGFSKGLSIFSELFDKIDFDLEIDKLIKSGIDKLYAKPCVGKVMPVVIGPGFGGVIFHEACGHAMEATSVADNQSVLAGELNNTIASKGVTIIDDGTLKDEWGTTLIDDEGNITQKNTLIKDGILVNYLIDEINNRKMKMNITGSGRRESYKYAPTSRMNNTYLENGTSSIDEMIKSIDLGLYAVKLGGGCVSPETGDFNFGCDLAYMIRDGKIAECVKSASLIGNTKEILKEVEMIGNDLRHGPGMCGSLSGSVPVNVGEPTIKIGHILVGGTSEK